MRQESLPSPGLQGGLLLFRAHREIQAGKENAVSDGWKQGYIGRAECAPKPLPTSRDVAERLCGISRNLDQPWALDRMASFIDAYVDVRVAEAQELIQKWRNEALGHEVESHVMQDKLLRGETITVNTTTEVKSDLRRCAAELESALAAARERWEKSNG